jgi:prevent-host-death family protein
MIEMTVTEARSRLADVVDESRVEHEPVFLTRRGRRVAAIIDAEQLEHLIEAAEDLADLRAAAESRAEIAAGEAPIPWDQVKADLGLTAQPA